MFARRRSEPFTQRRLAAILATFAVGLISTATAAEAYGEAAGPSAQARAAHAAFLLTATPPQVAGICLVDSGVTPNPDTTTVIDRLALSGDPSDQSPTLHGTTMAMHIGAAANGWGMVGLWPAVRIVSVRANAPGQDDFAPAGYINAIKRCAEVAATYDLRVIVLALSSSTPLSGDDVDALGDVVQAARTAGLNVVAAAGNTDGGPLTTPANIPGVLSVAASDTASNALCGFSATGALLLAPGCALDGADPASGQDSIHQGTSHASALAATALAALRSYKPELTPTAAEQILSESATPTPGGRLLNLTAAFVSQGLGAQAAAPTPAPPPPTPVVPDLTPKSKQRLPRPTVTVRARKHGHRSTLTIRVRNRPARATVRVWVYTGKRKPRQIASRTKTTSKFTIRVRSWSRLTVRFSDPTRRRTPSPTTTVTAKKARR